MRITRRALRYVLGAGTFLCLAGVAAYGYNRYRTPDSNRIKAMSCLRSLGPAIADSQAKREEAISALVAGGQVILMRHAQTTPGDSDPPNFDLGDRSTQRNLSDSGRDQAETIRSVFRDKRIKVGQVMSSQYARCLETGELAFGMAEQNAVLNAASNETMTQQGSQLKLIISNWKGPDNLVLITHSNNISALVGRPVGPADLIVLTPISDNFILEGILPITLLRDAAVTQPTTKPAEEGIAK